MKWIRKVYGVPTKRGMKVKVDGEAGVITSANHVFIMVRFDGKKHALPCHPTWRVEYEISGS